MSGSKKDEQHAQSSRDEHADTPHLEDMPPSHRPVADVGRMTLSFATKPLRLPDDSVPASVDDPLVLSRFPAGLPTSEPPTTASNEDVTSAMQLVERSLPPPPLSLDVEMSERFELGDYSSALRIAELILGRDAGHLQALAVAEASREKLVQHYSFRLGGLSACPKVIVDRSTVGWLGVDARAKTLLDHLDGVTTLADVLERSELSRLDTLRLLIELVDARAIRS